MLVPDLTGLGNGAKASEDVAAGLEEALHAAGSGGPTRSVSGCGAPSHLVLPPPADPAPRAPRRGDASGPSAPSAQPRPRAPVVPLMSLPRTRRRCHHLHRLTASRREEKQEQEGTNAIAAAQQEGKNTGKRSSNRKEGTKQAGGQASTGQVGLGLS